ncbi:unnamed protein product [Toxocara canis]|uniref:SWIRM domain-containing protein n=1 Tax=Toxocara canis TaxID=6265 RepID=A0A183UHD1_TOXCA|nr:unnamed protein product [Toxocara canis]
MESHSPLGTRWGGLSKEKNTDLTMMGQKMGTKIANFFTRSNANENAAENGIHISNGSNAPNVNSLARVADEREDSVEAELRNIFGGADDINIPADQQSIAPVGDVVDRLHSSQMGGRAEVKSEFRCVRSLNASSSSRSREWPDVNDDLRDRISNGSVRASRRGNNEDCASQASARSKKQRGPSEVSEAKEDGEKDEGDEDDQDDDEDEATKKQRVIIKALPTDLPKPTTFRVVNCHGQSKITDEWKEYALSIYPIRPNQYWDIRKEDYEALIPDRYLKEFAKGNLEKEKNAMIRSMYDWFRYQHRIAQLKVVLSECDVAMDANSLHEVYVKKMRQRGWPIYGKKLKKCEVTLAHKQLLESFLDGTMPGR